MNAIPLSEAADNLGRVIQNAPEGQPILLIQDGRVVAELHSKSEVNGNHAQANIDAAAAIESIKQRRLHCRLEGLSIRQLKEHGRP